MEGYGTDSEQIEALRNWWQKNGRYVTTGLVIAALVVAGWLLWNYWQDRQASAAAGLYATVVLAEQKGDVNAIVKNAHALIGEYPGTAYGALAAFALARAEFVQQHYDKAQSALRHVINNAPDRGFASIARLRLARVQMQQGDPKEALATLDKSKFAEAFSVSAATLRGAAYQALGRVADARNAWRAAQSMSEPGSSRYQLLAMRLAGLPAADADLTTKKVVHAAPVQSATQPRTTAAGSGASGATP
ncbi:MAG: tetratricopeptide repeat protein [Gammaproteobacteria bacterium]|nr:tetratricopeptide repeat protein [Gammaproteobacteria bacterium]